MSDTRSLLLLDVDGVLNPFPKTPAGFDEYDLYPDGGEPVRLAAAHRDWLHELAEVCELVWATGWGDEANRVLNPFFGLPSFPVVALATVPFKLTMLELAQLKVPAIDLFAGDRPAAWVDDMLTPEARAWANARQVATLLVDVDSATGLTRSQVETVLAWAAGLR